MENGTIFKSTTDPVPGIRRDLNIVPIQQNGEQYLYFQDQRGYVTPDLVLRREVGPMLSLIDGRKSISDLQQHVNGNTSQNELLDFVQMLDHNRLLRSNYFKQFAEKTETKYERSSTHTSVTAGNSYPADPQKLKEYLDDTFSRHETKVDCPNPKALYAPHIDPRVALEHYVKAFAPIRNLRPKRVVMLGTSHYAGWNPKLYEDHPFILVNKDFKLPLGTISRDKNAIAELAELDEGYGISTHDRAHRTEHSLELHLLFLSYLWDHDYQVVPFLVDSLQQLLYKSDGYHQRMVQRFSKYLGERFGGKDDTFFLISGDLAHFGQKFGDPQAASTMFNAVNQFDEHFMDYGAVNDASGMLDLMKEETDPYRICGFPPLYSFLNAMPELQGQIIQHDLWDERERESAVTFGSILYH